MRVVAQVAIHVHDERRRAMDPHRAAREESAFDAMRTAHPQHFTDRPDRFPVRFVVDRDGVDKCLDLPRRGQTRENRELASGKPRSSRSATAVRVRLAMANDGRAVGPFESIRRTEGYHADLEEQIR